MAYSEENYLMLSGIQHFEFCRRQWALIHIEQQWADNYRTTSGELMHKRVHDEELFERRGTILTVRGLRITSARLGMSGQCDVVEFRQSKDGIKVQGYPENWLIYPVEYKRGVPKEGQEDELQLCAQAMCLEDMFLTEIKKGSLFYGEKRRRHEVIFTEELRQKVETICGEMHQLFERGYTPKVKITKKCNACSLNEICIPKLQKVSNVSDYISKSIGEA
ncbi:MAG: CRISPR-associated protein Cas4 [Clostridia bacterium]|nr:CRISPR-associated protein Cas4 [Clostridia bacterium]NCD04207.1 CRISPR-associated protein Cas4 [Clostridia bacterium]